MYEKIRLLPNPCHYQDYDRFMSYPAQPGSPKIHAVTDAASVAAYMAAVLALEIVSLSLSHTHILSLCLHTETVR